MCVHVCTCACYCLQTSEEGTRHPGAVVAFSCRLPGMGAGMRTSPLGEQQVLVIVKPSLQSLFCSFKSYPLKLFCVHRETQTYFM